MHQWYGLRCEMACSKPYLKKKIQRINLTEKLIFYKFAIELLSIDREQYCVSLRYLSSITPLSLRHYLSSLLHRSAQRLPCHLFAIFRTSVIIVRMTPQTTIDCYWWSNCSVIAMIINLNCIMGVSLIMQSTDRKNEQNCSMSRKART